MFSNKYIFIYTSVLVVVVAAVLALAATLLQPMQTRNVEVEKMQNILNSAGIPNTVENAIDLYNKHIKAELMVNQQGNILSEYSFQKGQWTEKEGKPNAKRAFYADLKLELAKSNKSEAQFPVFICEKGDSKANSHNKIYIVPLQGKGLWGPIWGYMALESDLNTVVGVTFDHKGETPGLGAEISTPIFEEPFVGKQIFDQQGAFTSITVQKGGVKNYKGDPTHAVDAISGGTITSNGVTLMLSGCLQYYVPYFEQIRKANIEKLPLSTDTTTMAIDTVAKPL
ncbi:MAG: NADH:ubiquinone reductase (Na(+)-transporting) subunit C [Bacteroidales bacterium]